MKKIAITLLLIVALGLSGCAKPPAKVISKPVKPVPYIPFAAREKQLLHAKQWRIYGALSVKLKGARRIINFNWYQNRSDVFNIKFNTPGGFYEVALQNYYGSLTFWRTPTRFIKTNSFRNLMLSEFGWYVPFNEFYYWIRGVPLPKSMSKGKVVKKFDKSGRLVVLGQNGWVIHYEAFKSFHGHEVPTHISVFGRHTQFQIAVLQWVFYFSEDMGDIPTENKLLLKSF